MKHILTGIGGLILGVAIGFSVGVLNAEGTERAVRTVLSEQGWVGCKAVDDHIDRMICGGRYVVHGELATNLILHAQTSPDNNDEFKVGIDCRVWKPLLHWALGPVHSCSTAVG